MSASPNNISNVSNLTTVAAYPDTQNVILAFLSLLGIVCNLLVIITISLDKSLHNKSHFVLISLSFGEIFFCLPYCCFTLFKFLVYAFNISSSSFQVGCTLKEFPALAAGSVVKNLMLSLAVDRLMCMRAPVFYRSLSIPKYIACLNLLSWGHGIGVNLLAFVKSAPASSVLACSFATAMDRRFLYFYIGQDTLLTFIIVGMYSNLAWTFWRRYKQQKGSSLTESQEWRRQMDFEVFLAMVIVGVVYCIGYGTSTLTTGVGFLFMSNEILGIVAGVTLGATLVCSSSHLCVYYRVNKLFRNALLIVVFRKTVVTPM